MGSAIGGRASCRSEAEPARLAEAVEPRRDFIYQNALTVRNLDV